MLTRTYLKASRAAYRLMDFARQNGVVRALPIILPALMLLIKPHGDPPIEYPWG